MSIRVRMQDFRGPLRKRRSVEIISIDEFCRLGKVLSKKTMSDRHLVTELLAARMPDGTDHPAGIIFSNAEEGDVVFWLEQ
jgi:hypothetical protein